jgi:hypothetical protein
MGVRYAPAVLTLTPVSGLGYRFENVGHRRNTYETEALAL